MHYTKMKRNIYFLIIGTLLLVGFAIATTTITDTGIETGKGLMETLNFSYETGIPLIYFFPKGFEDSTSTFNRTAISFYSGHDKSTLRPLSIETHIGNDAIPHSNHVTLYSAVNNKSSPRALQWQWGPDANGALQMVDLSYLEFNDARWTGYYQNETGDYSGIHAKDENFELILDSNDDVASTTNFWIYNRNNSVSEDININIAQGRAVVSYSSNDGGLKLTGGSGKTVSVYTDGTSKAMTVDAVQNVTVENLAGSGSAYVCVDSDGTIYRSGSACV